MRVIWSDPGGRIESSSTLDRSAENFALSASIFHQCGTLLVFYALPALDKTLALTQLPPLQFLG